jgi:hypothetical protein
MHHDRKLREDGTGLALRIPDALYITVTPHFYRNRRDPERLSYMPLAPIFKEWQ